MSLSSQRKKTWKVAATAYIKSVVGDQGSFGGEDLWDHVAAERLISKARNLKTLRDRSSTWYDALRDYVVTMLLDRGLVEYQVNARTFARLSPDLKMGKGDAGEKKFHALVSKYGQDWVLKRVKIVYQIFPPCRVDIIVKDPDSNQGAPQPLFTNVEAKVETEYTFVGSGDILEKLEWTLAMGNRPVFEVGQVPTRVKSGKPRNFKRKGAI